MVFMHTRSRVCKDISLERIVRSPMWFVENETKTIDRKDQKRDYSLNDEDELGQSV